jgi:hypothetical protein
MPAPAPPGLPLQLGMVLATAARLANEFHLAKPAFRLRQLHLGWRDRVRRLEGDRLRTRGPSQNLPHHLDDLCFQNSATQLARSPPRGAFWASPTEMALTTWLIELGGPVCRVSLHVSPQVCGRQRPASQTTPSILTAVLQQPGTQI